MVSLYFDPLPFFESPGVYVRCSARGRSTDPQRNAVSIEMPPLVFNAISDIPYSFEIS